MLLAWEWGDWGELEIQIWHKRGARKKRVHVHKFWAGELEKEMRNVQTGTTYGKQRKKDRTGDCMPVTLVLRVEEAHGRYGRGLRVCKGCWKKCEGGMERFKDLLCEGMNIAGRGSGKGHL